MRAGSILSLDIGSMLIKGILGKEVKNNIKIENAFIFKTPAGAVSDGYILDSAGLGEEIHKQLTARKITPKQVVFSITSTEVVTRELLLPSVKKKEIRQMIVYEVDKLLPIQMEQYILDYSVLAKVVNEDSIIKSRVLVAAMPKAIAQGYWRLAAMLHLKPLSLTIHACSIAQLFQQQLQLNGQDFDPDINTVFLDIGYSYTECNVISKGNLLFHRTINLGGKSFTTEKPFSNSNDNEPNTGGLLPELQKITENIRPADAGAVNLKNLGSWLQEIRRILMYFSGLNSENRLAQIILTGGYTDIPGLAAYVAEGLEIPAEILNKISLVDSDQDWENTQKFYLNAIGAIKRK